MAASHRGCAKTQMRDRRMVGQLAIFDCRISTAPKVASIIVQAFSNRHFKVKHSGN